MADQVPGLLTRTIPATVRPRSRSSETRRGWLDGGRDPFPVPESTSLRYSRGAQPLAMLLAGEIDDRRPELVAVDRLSQVGLEARGAHPGPPQTPGAQARPPQSAPAGTRRPGRTCMCRRRSRNSPLARSAEVRSHTMTSAMRATRMASVALVAVTMAPHSSSTDRRE